MVKQGEEMEESAISSISSSVIKQEQEASSLPLVIKGVTAGPLPLNLEGVAGPGADFDGEGLSRKGHGHVAKAEAATLVSPSVVRVVAVGERRGERCEDVDAPKRRPPGPAPRPR